MSRPSIEYRQGNLLAELDSQLEWHRFTALVTKLFFWIKGNLLMFYFLLILPTFLFILSLYCLGGTPTGLRLGYVNHESSCQSFNRSCDAPISCRLLQRLASKQLELVALESADSAVAATKSNHVWASMVLASNLTSAVKTRLQYFSAEKQELAPTFGNELLVWIDNSNYFVSSLLHKYLYDAYQELVDQMYRDCGWNPRTAQPILKLQQPVFGSEEVDFSSSVANAAAPYVIFCSCITIPMAFLMPEKTSGTLGRTMAAGVTWVELILATQLVSLGIVVLQVPIMMVAVYGVHRVTMLGSVWWAAAVLLLQGSGSVCAGLIIAILMSDFGKCMYINNSILFGLSFLCGIIWPPEGMHWIARLLNRLIPIGPLVESMHSLSSRGLAGSDPRVYWGLLYSLGWTLFFLFILHRLSYKLTK